MSAHNSWIIQILTRANGEPSPYDGQYVVLYDPTPIVRGEDPILITTPYESQAKRFEDSPAAFAYYKLESGLAYPRNRPLTTYHVEMRQL